VSNAKVQNGFCFYNAQFCITEDVFQM